MNGLCWPVHSSLVSLPLAFALLSEKLPPLLRIMRVSLLLAVLAVSVSLVVGMPLHDRLRLNSTHKHHHAGSTNVACEFNGHSGQCQSVDSCHGTSVAGQSVHTTTGSVEPK